MGRYHDLMKSNFSAMRGNDALMWKHIGLVDELLDELREVHKDKYWAFMRQVHELMYGKHFDEAYARWQVEQMYHIGDDNREYKGEHWSLSDTTSVMQKYRGRIPSEYNEFDFYVALNSQWHDTICTAKRHFSTVDEAENYVIDEAVALWLNDSDWPSHDKVWRYFQCKL
jgi:hypothetical protein